MRRSKVELAMRILSAGRPLVLVSGGVTYMLDEQGRLCWVADPIEKDAEGNEFGHLSDMSFNSFVFLCERTNYEELWLKACEISLQESKEKPVRNLRGDEPAPEFTPYGYEDRQG